MVTNFVKVISIISFYLLFNSISSVHSGSEIDINGTDKQDLLITTLSSIQKEETVEVISPTIPPEPIVNPTHAPPSPPPSTTTISSSTSVEPTSKITTTTSTTVPSSSSTAVPAPPVTPPAPTPAPSGGKDRHFDGASFVGGIVLAAGLACIGFVGFKMYRARTERNYHTL